MNKSILITVIVAFLYGCNQKSIDPCDCCVNTYVNINDAFKCIEENPRKTSYDDRLFLIVFTDSKKKGWEIIEDTDILSVAKRNYLLVAGNKNEINSYNETTPELKDLIKKYEGQETFFIVVNQALYPFRDWDENESKKRIISELRLGNGP